MTLREPADAIALFSACHVGLGGQPHRWQREAGAVAGWGWGTHIVGVSAGRKTTLGDETVEPCITLWVRRKLPRRLLSRRACIPAVLALDMPGGACATDVRELCRPIVAHAGRIRPLRLGVDIAHVRGVTGTLGLLVTREGTDGTFALGCSHVLARSGVDVAENDPVDQPLNVPSEPEDAVGALCADFTVIRGRSNGAANPMDAALVRLSVPAEAVFADGTPGPVAVSFATAGQIAATWRNTLMSGATSGSVAGRVIGTRASMTVERVPFVGEAVYSNVVLYSTRCAEGDSGAAVLTPDGSTAIGLHVAGSSADRVGLFQPIGPVFQKYGLSLVRGN